MRFAQLVVGPAGSGKSTYCSAVAQYGADMNRNIEVINLDPAAEHFDYTPLVDIRELIQVQDTMEDEELHFGPNGGLVFCIEYLLENADWLRTRLGEHEDDYILFDCPGQIELYTHLTAIKRLITLLQDWNFNVCSVFLMDVQFMTDGSKFLSGDIELNGLSAFNLKYKSLTESFGKLIEDYSLVRFIPLNLKNHENMGDLLITIDNVIQYGEDQDIKTKDFEEEEPDVFENLTNE
ncbi:hypothetical protein HUJ04_000831 [Dendroctonus ponderosae]|nr:hypothetical protein HUJ04_000831 [Dendroctonus ponderosae]KAH1018629.1 hypothetical protein HUJ05_006358 [Dendroctonus ponderosae]